MERPTEFQNEPVRELDDIEIEQVSGGGFWVGLAIGLAVGASLKAENVTINLGGGGSCGNNGPGSVSFEYKF